MYILFMILAILAGLVLIAAVLIQPGKGDMTSGLSGGGMGGQFGSMIGMRRAADVLVKTTIGVAVFIMLLALVVNKVFLPQPEVTGQTATEKAEIPQTPIPSSAAPVQQQAAPAQQPAQQSAAPAQQPAQQAAPAQQPAKP